MGLKETNRERQIGIIPSQGADPIPVGKIPDGGTQVLKSNVAENSTAILYTVTTGKTLYLSTATLSVAFSPDVTGTSALFLRDQNDANAVIIFSVTHVSINGFAVGQSFFPPLEIPALWDICVSSGIAGLYAYGFIHGYEV